MALQDSICLLCKKRIQDPVVAASEHIFERAFIQECLDQGYSFGSFAQQLLLNSSLVPGHALRVLIWNWISSNSRDPTWPVCNDADQPRLKIAVQGRNCDERPEDDVNYQCVQISAPNCGHHQHSENDGGWNCETCATDDAYKHKNDCVGASPLPSPSPSPSPSSPSYPSSSSCWGSEDENEEVGTTEGSQLAIEPLQPRASMSSSPARSSFSVSMAMETEHGIAKDDMGSVASVQDDRESLVHTGASSLLSLSCQGIEHDICYHNKVSLGYVPEERGATLPSSSVLLLKPATHCIEDHSEHPLSSVQEDKGALLHSESSSLSLSLHSHGITENNNSCIRSVGFAEAFDGKGITQSQIKQRGGEMILECSRMDGMELMTNSRNPSLYCNSGKDSLIVTMVACLQAEEEKEQKVAVSKLRLMTKGDEGNRDQIVKAGALPPLVELLQCSIDRAIQRDSTTTILNLSLNPDIRPLIVEQGAILPLIRIVEHGLTSDAMGNAALALANLAAIQEYKARIGSAGAIQPLVGLLGSGSERGKKDAATALYMLSSTDENKRKIVRAGAIKLIVDFLSMKLDGLMDKALAILTNLVTIDEGRLALIVQGGTSYLMQIIQGIGSHIGKEMAISILLLLCNRSGNYRSIVLQENPIPSLLALSVCRNNRRIKAKAAQLLGLLQEHVDLVPMKAIVLKG